MPVKPEKVGIFITTNIDDKIHEFTKSMIYNPLLKKTSRHYSKYPLTTKDTEFVYDELKSKTYEDIVDFFFDPVLMAKATIKTSDTPTPTASPEKNTQLLDEKLTKLDKLITSELRTKMSTSGKGISPNLSDVSNIIVILKDSSFDVYNTEFKKMINIVNTNPQNKPNQYINRMLNNGLSQPEMDGLDVSIKNKITELKKKIMLEIDNIRKEVVNKLSVVAFTEDLTNLTVRKKHKQDVENECLNKNINMMMYRLFPKTNLSASTFMSSIIRKIFPMHQTFKYSYLKIDGDTYTVVQYNWSKFIFNHPLYRKLFDGMVKYIEWTEEQSIYAQTYRDETNEKILQIVKLCSGDDIYKNNDADYIDTISQLTSQSNPGVGRSVDTDYTSAINILITLLEELIASPINNTKILNILSQFSAYKKARDVISEIKVRPLRQYIQKMLDLNTIKDEVDFYEEHFFRGANIDLKYDFPSRLASKIDNEPIKRLQKIINDDFLPSQRTSTNYEFQSKFEDYLNNNGTEFVDYIKDMKTKFISNPENRNMPNKTKFGYDTNSKLDINLNVIQGKEYKYEIYVHFDVIKGQVSDVNRGIMKCPYLNDTLVEKWNNVRTNIIFPFWEPPKLPFFEVKNVETKKGGRSGTRYQRKKYNKTRKSRKTFYLEFLHL